MNLLTKLWNDDAGAILSLEYGTMIIAIVIPACLALIAMGSAAGSVANEAVSLTSQLAYGLSVSSGAQITSVPLYKSSALQSSGAVQGSMALTQQVLNGTQ